MCTPSLKQPVTWEGKCAPCSHLRTSQAADRNWPGHILIVPAVSLLTVMASEKGPGRTLAFCLFACWTNAERSCKEDACLLQEAHC